MTSLCDLENEKKNRKPSRFEKKEYYALNHTIASIPPQVQANLINLTN